MIDKKGKFADVFYETALFIEIGFHNYIATSTIRIFPRKKWEDCNFYILYYLFVKNYILRLLNGPPPLETRRLELEEIEKRMIEWMGENGF